MDESETLISEREIPRMLAEYQVFAVSSIQNGQMQQGFDILVRSQELIQAAVSQEAIVSAELIILTEHTLAFYYQSIGDFFNVAKSLATTVALFKKYIKSLPKSFLNKPTNRIFKSRILLKLHLQLINAYSKLDMLEEAILSAKSVMRRSQTITHNVLRSCQDHLARHKTISANSVKNQQYVLLESPHYQLFHSLVMKAMPILLFLDEKTSFVSKIQIPSPDDLKIEDFIMVLPWNFETLLKGPEIMEELERDLMIEKIIFHILSHYFLGNLLKQSRSEEHQIESTIMLKRSYQIARSFLPLDNQICVMVSKSREKSKPAAVSRIRSNSRIKTPGKLIKSEPRSASTNKFRTSPSKKFTETYSREVNSRGEQLVPLRKKIIGKFQKFKLK